MKIQSFAPLALGTALAFAVLAGCSSTTLESSWKAPEVGSIHFNKILVMAASPNVTLRRATEDAMRAQISTATVITGYELLPNPDDVKNEAKLRAAVKASGVDGIITLRSVSDEKEVNVNTTYNSFYGYYGHGGYRYGWGYGAGMPYASTTVSTDRIVGIETNIYSAQDEKLIWTALTKSTNLSKPEDFVKEVAEVVRKKLREQKLIPDAPK
jgi:hypothetical protein